MSAPTAPRPTPMPRSTTARWRNATGSLPRRATSRPRSTLRSRATTIPRAVVETLVEPRAPVPPRCSVTRGCARSCSACRSYHLYDNFLPVFRSDKAYPYEQARDARAGVGRAAGRRLRCPVPPLRHRRPHRRLRERRQEERRLQRRRLRRRPVPAAQLQRHARRGVHARPRGRPCDAYRAVVRERSPSSPRTTRSSSPRSPRPPTNASCSSSCCSRPPIRRSASCCCSTRSIRSSAPSTPR